MCIEFIYRHIRKLPSTQIFTTREVLIYGARAAIDIALHRMVKAGFIVRLARGVFVRDNSSPPPLEQIVLAKAKAFRRKFAEHPESILRELGISAAKNDLLFATDGDSSSFDTIHGRVFLKRICPRKISMLETLVGRIVYAIWHLGRGQFDNSQLQLASHDLKRSEREQLWLLSSVMPNWLTDLCRHRFPRCRLNL